MGILQVLNIPESMHLRAPLLKVDTNDAYEVRMLL